MKLKAVIDSLDGLDAPFHPLYTERDGKFLLTGIEGIATEADMQRLQRALSQEKEAHKKTKEKLAQPAEDPDAVRSITERIKAACRPLATTIAAISKERGELKAANDELTAAEKRRIIHDAVRAAAADAKMLGGAIDDALVQAERALEVDQDGNITPSAEDWLAEMQPKRLHWWPVSVGGGAKGSGGSTAGLGDNPWSAKSWNLTEQGRVYRADPRKAERMAEAAGTKIGGARPTR